MKVDTPEHADDLEVAPVHIAYTPPAPRKPSRWPRVILIFLIIAILGVLGIWWGADNLQNGQQTPTSNPPTTEATVPFTPSPDSAYRSAWLTYLDDGTGLETFKANAKQFTEFHPFWYEAQSATTIAAQGSTTFRQSALQTAKSANVKVVPTITESLKTEPFLTMMNNPQSRTQHVNTVCQLAKDNDFAGIDIDYELFALNVSTANVEPAKAAFTGFITELATCLHNANKTLEVTLLPKTDDAAFAPYLTSIAPGVFDYKAIGEVADIVRPMAYDHATPLTKPGSTDPITWVKAVGEYTRKFVPANKVVLGLALYGYDWNAAGAKSITARQAIALAKAHDAELQYNDDFKTRYFEYKATDGTAHQVWFDTSADTKQRANIAKELGLAGVSYWSLGNEDRDFTNYLATVK
jgi:spore germination protein